MEGVATKQLESRISCKKLLCKSESTMNLSFFVSELTWRWKCMFGLSVSSLLAPQFMSRCLYILGSFILQLGIVITVQAEPTRSVEVVSIWILTHSSYWLCFGHYIRSWISSSCSRDLAVSLSFSYRWDIIFPMYSVRFYFTEVG
jgi:hypothetical protein